MVTGQCAGLGTATGPSRFWQIVLDTGIKPSTVAAMPLFGPRKLIQSYDEAVALIEAGDARLVIKSAWQDKTSSDTPLKNSLELDHAIYTAFAKTANSGDLKSFICGPFGEWDGTSHGVFYDGMVFGTLRQPFMDALQHHRNPDGAAWLWAFVTRWQSFMVLSPAVKVVEIWVLGLDDETEQEFESAEACNAARESNPTSKWSWYGPATRIKPVTP